MQRTNFGEMGCSVARTLHLIGEPWSPLILRDVYVGITRFDDLQADLGIARNVLAARLEWLVEHGVLDRHIYDEAQRRYDYRLSEKGRELAPVLMAFMAWGDRWTAGEAGPPANLRHVACGELSVPVVVCDKCREPLTAETVTVEPGPGGFPGPGTRLVGLFSQPPERRPPRD